jgi:prefoldin subunit 5
MTKVEEKQRVDALEATAKDYDVQIENIKARMENLNKRTKELLEWITSQTEGNA